MLVRALLCLAAVSSPARAAVVDFSAPDRLPAVSVEDSSPLYKLYQDATASALLRVGAAKRGRGRLLFGASTVVVCARDKGCASPDSAWSRPRRGDIFLRAEGRTADDRGAGSAASETILVQFPPVPSPYHALSGAGTPQAADPPGPKLVRAAAARARLDREGGELGRTTMLDESGVVVELLRLTKAADLVNPAPTAAVLFPMENRAIVDGAGLGSSRVFIAAPGASFHVEPGARVLHALLIYGRPASP
jgi:hypothetical protein